MSNPDNPYGGPYGNGGEGGQDVFRASVNPDAPSGNQTPSFVLGGDQPPAGSAPGPVVETSTANFTKDVVEASRQAVVLVDFWAPWCGPCKQLAPALEKAVRETGGSVKLVKMNIDDHPAIAGQLGIQSIPAVIAFRDGQPVDGFMGALPESQIREFIQRVAGDAGGDGVEEAMAQAAEARANGDDQTAAQIYSAVLQQAPETVVALGGLADILYEAGQVDQAKQVLERVPEAKKDAAEIAAVRAKMALAEQVADLGDPAELEARLAANPKDHQARFDLAVIRNAQGRREEAADTLLAIVMADREWNEGAARQQLLKFFEAWGAGDEVTLSARRRLSSVLFS